MIEKLYCVYYQELICYVRKMTGERKEAEDVVQETFLRAIQHEEMLEKMSDSQCRSWLYKTARNYFIDLARRDKKCQSEEVVMVGQEDFTEIMVAEICEILEPLEKAIFLLRYFEGYQANEIGEMLGESPVTIRSRLLRARKKLKKYLNLSKKDDKNQRA